MFRSREGSTQRLIELCIGYFFFYVITGLTVKYFQGSAADGYPGYKAFEFLFYSCVGGQLICLAVVFYDKWYKLKSTRYVNIFGRAVPQELLYIIPSGVCTAVIIPSTTLMYSLPISVMVAMVIMRGAIIIISRIVDEVQIRQGLLKKKVYASENIAVIFATLAVAVHLTNVSTGGFDFIGSVPAMTILIIYLIAYCIRIYIMNYFKNTAGKGVSRDNKVFFGIEQISAGVTLFIVAGLLFFSPQLFGWTDFRVIDFRSAVLEAKSDWWLALLAGMAFGMVAFYSVFLFMFKGRTATFAGLVNRLTSLVAGTAATLILYFFFGGRFPGINDWISLGFILVAVVFLTSAEKRRTRELIATKELLVTPPLNPLSDEEKADNGLEHVKEGV